LQGIQEMTGKTFIQFLNDFRIQKAQEGLDEGIYTISELMYNCGFKDPSYFSKQFKQKTNCSPSEYLAMEKI